MKQFYTLLLACLAAMTLQAQTTKELDGYPTIFSDYDAYYNKWILEDEYFKTTSWFKKGWSTFYRFANNTYRKASMYISEGDSIVAGIAYARVLIDQKTLLYRQEGDKVFARTDGEDAARGMRRRCGSGNNRRVYQLFSDTRSAWRGGQSGKLRGLCGHKQRRSRALQEKGKKRADLYGAGGERRRYPAARCRVPRRRGRMELKEGMSQ